MESYRTLSGRTEARIVEKKSEFIAAGSPVQTEAQALCFLREIRTQHPAARHNVYAYQLREDARVRYCDDGEPAKTAGTPVLSVISHAGITDCIIVVTRYFGGTLLGTGGLVRAYTSAAKKALDAAEILTVRLCVTLSLTLTYSQYQPVCRLLESIGAKLGEPTFTDSVCITGTLPEKKAEPTAAALREMLRGEVNAEWSAPFFYAF